MRLWTDANLAELDIASRERERARTFAELSNLVRYEVLHRFGGVYVDTDVECRGPLAAYYEESMRLRHSSFPDASGTQSWEPLEATLPSSGQPSRPAKLLESDHTRPTQTDHTF